VANAESCTIEKTRFDSTQGQETYLFSETNCPAVGHTQPLETNTCGQRGKGVKLTTHMHLTPRLGNFNLPRYFS
jgi:hypothetical protein